MSATDYKQPMKQSILLAIFNTAGNQQVTQMVVNNAEYYFVDIADGLIQKIND